MPGYVGLFWGICASAFTWAYAAFLRMAHHLVWLDELVLQRKLLPISIIPRPLSGGLSKLWSLFGSLKLGPVLGPVL